MKKLNENLVPNHTNTSPDYYCTWQTQLYATSDGKPEGQRACITENSLFNENKPYGWANFYEDARSDLFIVMDDSWDVPLNDYQEYYGSLVLNKEKFPSYVDENAPEKSLKNLSEEIKKRGWKGLGGWVCAQESPLFSEGKSVEEYWKERLVWSQNAGLNYWKVDWGMKDRDIEFRKQLVNWAKEVAPDVIIENAILTDVIPYSDTFRTYDVPEILSIPMTMEKLENTLKYTAENGYAGIVNCEDEAYVGAALGCSIGIMRHEYAGVFPNGKADMSFPECHRNVKTRANEVTRAVRWHRIAPAFGANGENTYYSDEKFTDFWQLENIDEELERWWLPILTENNENKTVIQSTATSAISRNMPLPQVLGDKKPFVVCAKNPNGAVSVATLGRTEERTFEMPLCDVKICSGNADTFGVFGCYKSLSIATEKDLSSVRIKAQDLAADIAFDITEDVAISDGVITLSGEIIDKIGNYASKPNDNSDPGLVMVIEDK